MRTRQSGLLTNNTLCLVLILLVVRHIDIHSNFDYALNLSYYDGDIADMLNINMSVH